MRFAASPFESPQLLQRLRAGPAVGFEGLAAAFLLETAQCLARLGAGHAIDVARIIAQGGESFLQLQRFRTGERRIVGGPGLDERLLGIEPGGFQGIFQRVVEEADRQGALIRLYVDYADARLFDYYTQFGFEQEPAGGEIMERLPKTKPAPRLEAGLRRSKP